MCHISNCSFIADVRTTAVKQKLPTTAGLFYCSFLVDLLQMCGGLKYSLEQKETLGLLQFYFLLFVQRLLAKTAKGTDHDCGLCTVLV